MQSRAFAFGNPASESTIETLRREFPQLPGDYFEFLLRSNGAEGLVGISPGYCVLWPAEEVKNMTLGYELHKYLPGYVCVGSSGGGDLYVYPVTGTPKGIFLVPAIGMAPKEVELVAPSISELELEFGREWVYAQPSVQADGPASGGPAA